MNSGYRLRWLGVMLLGATLAPRAHADSIVFIKEHDVWVAAPDGSGGRAVTSDGDDTRPYRSPSQADDGRIWAAHGPEIVQLDRQGNELARFQPPLGPDGFAPSDVAVSPDGTRVAYTVHGRSCYVSSDGSTSHGYELHVTDPEWVTNDMVLAFGGMPRQVVLDSIGGGTDDGVVWFNDPENVGLRDGELSRQGNRLVVLRDVGDATHLIFVAVQDDTRPPQPACRTHADPSLDDPSWSPDGTRVAVANAEGIEIVSVAGDCAAESLGVVIPGGSEPDWGPADVEARSADRVDFVGVPSGVRLRKALRRGLTLTVETNASGTLAGHLRVDGETVSSGSAALAPGTGTVAFRFAKQARKRLMRRKSLTIVADLMLTTESGAVLPITASLELTR
jgi:hypothetical protein